jgi:hypothetical protein
MEGSISSNNSWRGGGRGMKSCNRLLRFLLRTGIRMGSAEVASAGSISPVQEGAAWDELSVGSREGAFSLGWKSDD